MDILTVVKLKKTQKVTSFFFNFNYISADDIEDRLVVTCVLVRDGIVKYELHFSLYRLVIIYWCQSDIASTR
ncbi:hypothetical protein T4D_14498 [Trichinella pseudospiralis]|uniref:Uncharacterized protein n=1 Tax=Trichinella pseudospiralis TaxID=6337 RepID=A0A0V1F803_TRIPS|nr:hypothetical protein T4D_14498 [Trichinella pseudospiralis]